MILLIQTCQLLFHLIFLSINMKCCKMMAITNLTCQTSLTIDAHEPLKLTFSQLDFLSHTSHHSSVSLTENSHNFLTAFEEMLIGLYLKFSLVQQ